MIEIINKPITENMLYRVKDGDTMESICKKFGTTTQRIFADNPYFSELYAGCILYMSHCNKNIYIVQPLDTIESISKKLKISAEKLTKDNNIKSLFIGQMLEY